MGIKKYNCSVDNDEDWLNHAPRTITKNENGDPVLTEKGSRVDKAIIRVWMTATREERVAVHNFLHNDYTEAADYLKMSGLMSRVEEAVKQAEGN